MGTSKSRSSHTTHAEEQGYTHHVPASQDHRTGGTLLAYLQTRKDQRRASLPQPLPNGPPSSPSGVSVPVQRSSFWPLTSHASSVTSSTRSQSCGSTLSTRPRTATSHSRWLTLSGSAPL